MFFEKKNKVKFNKSYIDKSSRNEKNVYAHNILYKQDKSKRIYEVYGRKIREIHKFQVKILQHGLFTFRQAIADVLGNRFLRVERPYEKYFSKTDSFDLKLGHFSNNKCLDCGYE